MNLRISSSIKDAVTTSYPVDMGVHRPKEWALSLASEPVGNGAILYFEESPAGLLQIRDVEDRLSQIRAAIEVALGGGS